MLFLAGCGGPPDAASESDRDERQVFDVAGRVTSVPADGETLVIEHEEIPGFMPAMTMPFYLASPDLSEGVEPGDAIRFRYVVEDRSSQIEEIEQIDASELSVRGSQEIAAQRQRLPIPRLEPGDPVPGFQLVNQEEEAFSMTDFYGKAVVLTFIFTRCPVPEFCPKMSHQFQEIQEKAAASEELQDEFQLLSVTIDPEYDTPEILDQYASQFTDDTSTWFFATGSPGRIDEMTTRFSVFIEDNSETNTIDHVLTTALISPEGEVVEIWRGNSWEADEVLASIQTTLNQNE